MFDNNVDERVNAFLKACDDQVIISHITYSSTNIIYIIYRPAIM